MRVEEARIKFKVRTEMLDVKFNSHEVTGPTVLMAAFQPLCQTVYRLNAVRKCLILVRQVQK